MFRSDTLLRMAVAVAASYLLLLVLNFGRDGGFLIGNAGRPLAVEFVGVYTAGELAAEGRPEAAYGWAAHAGRQDGLTGTAESAYYPFAYPPPYLAVAAALASLPYSGAAVLWIAGSLAFWCWSAIVVSGRRRAAAFVLAAPPTFVNASLAHTGFLFAGLYGLGLELLPTAPIAAGATLGLLSLKPHLGLLLPVALLAGGHRRALAAAMATAAGLIMVSVALFGFEPWSAFIEQTARISDIFRYQRTDMTMLATAYGLARTLGAGHEAALGWQAAVGVSAAVAVFVLWRSAASDALKCAGVIVGGLLASPYLYVYDQTLLVVALLFLHTAVGARGFSSGQIWAILAAASVAFVNKSMPVPIAFFATVVVAGMVAHVWWGARRPSRPREARGGGAALAASTALAAVEG